VYPNNPNIHSLTNTIIYGGFCYSLRSGPNWWVSTKEPRGVTGTGGIFGFGQAFAPAGSNSTYYGYLGTSPTEDDIAYGVPLFNALINQYKTTGEAYNATVPGAAQQAVLAPSPDARAGQNSGNASDLSIWIGARSIGIVPDSYRAPPPSPPPAHFGIWNDQNLAYVGNPKLTKTDLNPPVPGSQGLAAYMDGTASCGMNGAPYMSVDWTNHTNRDKGGYLDAVTNLVSGQQDDFFNQASETPPESTPGTLVSDWALAKWTPSPELPGNSDDIVADFYPDMTNPIAARACLIVRGVAGLFVENQVATVWDEQQPAQRAYEAPVVPPRKIAQPYEVPLSDAGGYTKQGATASVIAMPNGKDAWTVTVMAGGANPNYDVINPQPGSGPFMGLAQIGLEAINPGPAGSAMVKVTGKVSNTLFCQTVGSPPQKLCTFPSGSISVIDSNGKVLETGSIDPEDNGAIGPSFSVMADSSCSGLVQTTPQCGVSINVSVGEVAGAPSPTTFSVTLNILFLNSQ